MPKAKFHLTKGAAGEVVKELGDKGKSVTDAALTDCEKLGVLNTAILI